MHKYIYMYDPKRELEENEIMKLNDPYKFVVANIAKLEEWSGKKYDLRLYDSDRDEKDYNEFNSEILYQTNLYFIVIDSENNVFGHYHPREINDCINLDDNTFLFTLYSNERCGVKKFDVKGKLTFMPKDIRYY